MANTKCHKTVVPSGMIGVVCTVTNDGKIINTLKELISLVISFRYLFYI